MRATATWISLGVLALSVGGCQPKAPARPAAAAAAAAPITAPPTPAPAAPEVSAVSPETMAAVTQALAVAQAFNAGAAADLAALAKAEKRTRELAGQASDAAARSSGGIAGADHQALARRVELARTQAEAAHADVAARAAAFRAGAQAQTDAVALVQLQCAQAPEFAATEPCVKLAAEQATLAQNVATLTARFAAVEAGYQKDRANLDEASATMVLGAR